MRSMMYMTGTTGETEQPWAQALPTNPNSSKKDAALGRTGPPGLDKYVRTQQRTTTVVTMMSTTTTPKLALRGRRTTTIDPGPTSSKNDWLTTPPPTQDDYSKLVSHQHTPSAMGPLVQQAGRTTTTTTTTTTDHKTGNFLHVVTTPPPVHSHFLNVWLTTPLPPPAETGLPNQAHGKCTSAFSMF